MWTGLYISCWCVNRHQTSKSRPRPYHLHSPLEATARVQVHLSQTGQVSRIGSPSWLAVEENPAESPPFLSISKPNSSHFLLPCTVWFLAYSSNNSFTITAQFQLLPCTTLAIHLFAAALLARIICKPLQHQLTTPTSAVATSLHCTIIYQQQLHVSSISLLNQLQHCLKPLTPPSTNHHSLLAIQLRHKPISAQTFSSPSTAPAFSFFHASNHKFIPIHTFLHHCYLLFLFTTVYSNPVFSSTATAVQFL